MLVREVVAMLSETCIVSIVRERKCGLTAVGMKTVS